MITDLWIENFQGIGKRQHIPLRPITLLFGANSAGKSTVLHALLYLPEILRNHNFDPKLLLDGEANVIQQTVLTKEQIDLGDERWVAETQQIIARPRMSASSEKRFSYRGGRSTRLRRQPLISSVNPL